jgi:hypothetical protein
MYSLYFSAELVGWRGGTFGGGYDSHAKSEKIGRPSPENVYWSIINVQEYPLPTCRAVLMSKPRRAVESGARCTSSHSPDWHLYPPSKVRHVGEV